MLNFHLQIALLPFQARDCLTQSFLQSNTPAMPIKKKLNWCDSCLQSQKLSLTDRDQGEPTIRLRLWQSHFGLLWTFRLFNLFDNIDDDKV